MVVKDVYVTCPNCNSSVQLSDPERLGRIKFKYCKNCKSNFNHIDTPQYYIHESTSWSHLLV